MGSHETLQNVGFEIIGGGRVKEREAVGGGCMLSLLCEGLRYVPFKSSVLRRGERIEGPS